MEDSEKLIRIIKMKSEKCELMLNITKTKLKSVSMQRDSQQEVNSFLVLGLMGSVPEI